MKRFYVPLLVGLIMGQAFLPMMLCDHIILFGRTGSGKSYVLNRISLANQEKIKECWDDISCTKNLTSVYAFNGDILTEVPGYFDTEGNDLTNQALFVDFLKEKTVRAIVFLYTDRADSFMQAAAAAFKNSGFNENLIFVKNKVPRNSPEQELSKLLDCPKVAIRMDQEEMDILKTVILQRKPMKVVNLIAPISLFRLPLELVKNEIVEIPREEKIVPTKISILSGSRIDHYEEKCVWAKPRWLSIITGEKDCWLNPIYKDVYQEVIVNKPHRVIEKVRLMYATRFDGVADVYAKEHVEFITVPIGN